LPAYLGWHIEPRPHHPTRPSSAPQGCHKGYWLGYKAATWGANNFAPLDSTIPFNKNSYRHWGLKMTATRNASEPDGKSVPELCMVANQTATFDGAYGWADVSCNTNKFVFMCRVIRECRWPYSLQPLQRAAGLCSCAGQICMS
jgi:hypothetical protein